jgi:glycerol kinase
MLENVAEVRHLASTGHLAFGQPDTWFIYNLTSGARYLTDHSTASRSGLYNIHSGDWDEDLLRLFDAKDLCLPEIRDTSSDFGRLQLGKGWQLPLRGSALDQAAALLGQGCTGKGEAKVTYGTCAALWCNTGSTPLNDPRLSTSVAWQIDGRPTYSIVGEVKNAGALVEWLCEKIRIPWAHAELAEVAQSAAEIDDLIFVPAFSGLGAPHWVPEARGVIYGLTAAVGLKELVRASLDSIAFGVRDALDALIENGVLELTDSLKADGGMIGNEYLMQIQADILGRKVAVPETLEGTLLGVAFLAGLSEGVHDDVGRIRDMWRARRVFAPNLAPEERERRYARWVEAVARTAASWNSPPK